MDIIIKNKPGNTVKTENTTCDALAEILKCWASNMPRKGDTEYKEDVVKTIENLIAKMPFSPKIPNVKTLKLFLPNEGEDAMALRKEEIENIPGAAE
ncbi:hypothetical protein FQR65_LT02444 [Abscondita terminalis]|nr:hypothetical protein FQR65_LT02444 [Abscondita terminalis]